MRSRALSEDFTSPVALRRTTGRPRPIHVQEKLPVYFAGLDAELEASEDTDFNAWLLEGGRTSQGCVNFVGNDDKPLKPQGDVLFEVPDRYRGRESLAVSQKESGESCVGGRFQKQHVSITVPGVREVERLDQGMISSGIRPAQLGDSIPPEPFYLRYGPALAKDFDSLVEYDLEEEDDSWLHSHNMAITSPRLPEDSFEVMIDRLDKEYCRSILLRLRSTEEGCSADWLSPQRTLCLDKVRNALPKGLHGHLISVHQYWLTKPRAFPPGICGALCPLVQRLRADIWPLLVPSPTPGVPFLARDVHPGIQCALNTELSYDAMVDQRGDLEQLRTLADMIRKREKLKRQATRLWIAGLNQTVPDCPVRINMKSEALVNQNNQLPTMPDAPPAFKQPSRRLGLRGTSTKLQDHSNPNAGMLELPCITSNPTKTNRNQRKQAASSMCLTCRACGWCGSRRPCVACDVCQRGFCYACFRTRKGLGVRGWTLAVHNGEGYRCAECTLDESPHPENCCQSPAAVSVPEITGDADTDDTPRKMSTDVNIPCNSPQFACSFGICPYTKLQPIVSFSEAPKDWQQYTDLPRADQLALQPSPDHPDALPPQKRGGSALLQCTPYASGTQTLQSLRGLAETSEEHRSLDMEDDGCSMIRQPRKRSMPPKNVSREVRNLINSKALGVMADTRIGKKGSAVGMRVTRTSQRRCLRTTTRSWLLDK